MNRFRSELTSGELDRLPPNLLLQCPLFLIAESSMSESMLSPGMSDQDASPKRWPGVLASFLVSGAGMFFNGRKREGIAWFLFFITWSFVGAWLLASPVTSGVVLGFAAQVLALIAWLVMLTRSTGPAMGLTGKHWIILVALFLAVPWVRTQAVWQVAHPFYVPTSTMQPTLMGESVPGLDTLKDGDHVIALTCAYWFREPARGDIVVFTTDGVGDLLPGQVFVKRVVGLPGDKLSIDREGRLMNQGEPVTEPEFFRHHKYLPVPLPYPSVSLPMKHPLRAATDVMEVPPGHLFVIGDNSANSRDSRSWGPLPRGAVIGKVTKVYWPWKRARSVD
jgi:signal peptidase I